MSRTQAWWPTFGASDLRHKVQIQARAAGQDSVGQPIGDWATVRSCFARIDAMSGREEFADNQTTSQVTDMIIVRYTRTPLEPGMQVVFGPHAYRIQAIDNIRHRNKYVKLLCLEINAGASA